MPLKFITTALMTGCTIIALSLYYFSDKKISERDFLHMLDSETTDLDTIDNYLQHHGEITSLHYVNALQLAANLDSAYLDKVIDYYTTGRLILKTDTARLILQQLPSDAVNINHAAGNIYATNEFQLYDPQKATQYLEFAALRGDRNAAASLTSLYTNASCYIEAITWARVANRRDSSSECSQLPVDINLLSDEELDATIENEKELSRAVTENRLPELHYSKNCSLRQNN